MPKFTGFRIVPPALDVCQECAVKHLPEEPHDGTSLYYQYHFYATHDFCWPTWADAMAHCTPEVQQLWRDALAEHGVKI